MADPIGNHSAAAKARKVPVAGDCRRMLLPVPQAFESMSPLCILGITEVLTGAPHPTTVSRGTPEKSRGVLGIKYGYTGSRRVSPSSQKLELWSRRADRRHKPGPSSAQSCTLLPSQKVRARAWRFFRPEETK